MASNFSIKHQPGFTAIAATCFVVLYLPIIVLVAYAFNAASSTSEWGGFSLRWFQSAYQNTQVIDATLRSFQIGAIAAVLSTTFATMEGTARTAGGISVTPRDLARIGEMMRQGGTANGRRIVPEAWVRDTVSTGGSAEAWQRGTMAFLFPYGRYRNKWYQTGKPSGAYCGIGIHASSWFQLLNLGAPQHLCLENGQQMCQGSANSFETPISGAPWQFWQPSTI